MRRLLILLVKAYQLLLSPVMAGRCRFYPSCSHYTVEALQEYGALRGSWLSICRIARCHPLNDGGYDPVPPCQCKKPQFQLSRPSHND
ncbi:putative membrane protein insertion efficiency factor [Spongiibacter sp. IMCC21906]|uniref:membrane protein insertion efficiency factor YidD n=1 Tax=Spongiibacter sp. IMCC21906 TaxID=1620392 RepID=UPI00062DFCE4|nr:membrane protein insertion efficiency factor YidD [Spongiibacter sp. IMCC21906]AKH68120.1 putative membrane protein insertion efficiency factor [Spongiibacter sp. IMCC21906]